MQSARQTRAIAEKLALDAGFVLAGIAVLPSTDEQRTAARVQEFVESGRAGNMEYLKRRAENGELLRARVGNPFPWARSMIVCAANYNAAAPRSIDPAPEGSGWIARYAWSGTEGGRGTRPTDYHKVLRRRLERIEAGLKTELGNFVSRCFVDTGPVMERAHAVVAGLGWIGKNTCLIHPQLGSWLFLGVILTDLELAEEPAAMVPDRCGSCTRCIDACPTGALIAPRQMDAGRCIAYLTIEERGTLPEPLLPQMGRQLFGCDICQDVCPWNRKAPIAADPELEMRPELVNPSLEWLAQLDEEGFGRIFNGSPVRRAGWNGFRRNLAVAAGNIRAVELREVLTAWSRSEDTALQRAAQWALRKIAQQAGPATHSS